MNLVKLNHRPSFIDFISDFNRNMYRNESSFQTEFPSVNIMEEKSRFIIDMAAPGLKKEDFKINLDNQTLTISKEMKEENEEVNDNYTRREFGFTSFSRSFRLPKTIVGDQIKADYKDGILSISLPKDEKAILTREISVN